MKITPENIAILVIVIMVMAVIAWVTLMTMSGSGVSRWRVLRIIEVREQNLLRIRMDLVTADGRILKEITVQGAEGVWYVEDDWGNPGRACNRDMSISLAPYWAMYRSGYHLDHEHK